MKILKPLLLLCIVLILNACSGGNSSTNESAEAAETTVTTESGVTVSFDTNEATVDEVFEFFYDLGGDAFTGTIRWGDNTETRVRGSGSARHIYRVDGERSISIQIDGGVSERVGRVLVSASASVTSSNSARPQNSAFPQRGVQSCAVSGTLTLQSSSGITYQIVRTVTSPGFFNVEFFENGLSVSAALDELCPRDLAFSAVIGTSLQTDFDVGDTILRYNAN